MSLTTYAPEPRTAAEAMERARASYSRTHAVAPRDIRPRWERDAPSISSQMSDAHALLSDLSRFRRGVPKIVRSFVASVAIEHGITADELMGKSRARHVVLARWDAMVRIKEATDASTPQIGKWFGRDHTSVIHALKMMRAQ